jgi:hypothetical protein
MGAIFAYNDLVGMSKPNGINKYKRKYGWKK